MKDSPDDGADHTSAIPIAEGFSGPQTVVNFNLNDIPVGSAALIVVKGPQVGDAFVLSEQGSILGRGEEADLILDDVTVSRKHAKIEKNSNVWTIVDLDSLNGTYVNRNRVNTQVLTGGEELQIGKYRFAFLLPTVGSE
jgi:pSer/pThr/pTyr-binding forkhead associated (FHA) protein